ncbi:MAG: hypothetical protein KGM96_09270 [Acidobacteriota bacterium]|nr:hypothetical protein [Acidobacteriota bacterium]
MQIHTDALKGFGLERAAQGVVAQTRRGRRAAVGLAMLAILLSPMKSGAQQTYGTQQISGPPRPTSIIQPAANHPPDANDQMLMQEHQLKKQQFEVVNAERKRELDTESANLLILAKDLNAQVLKLGSKPLPARLVREAEVIELLAHDVQTKMKLTTGGG